MKNFVLFCCVFFGITHFVNAQESSLLIAADNAEKMTIVLDGAAKNQEPQTQVIIDNIMPGAHKIKVMKHNTGAPQMVVEKTIYLDPSTRVYINLKLNNKNEYVLRPYNSEPYFPKSANNANTINPNPNNVVVNPNPNNVVVNPNPNTGNVNMNMSTNSTINPNPNENVNVNISVGVDGMNFNLNANTNGMTNTTTNSTMNSNTTISNPNTVIIPNYNGPYGCAMPTLNQADFAAAKQSIKAQSFSDTQETIARQVIQSNCLLSAQVKELMLLFTFEESKLNIAKFAYTHTCDVGRYYEVNSAFQFSSSVDDLNAYIQSHR